MRHGSSGLVYLASEKQQLPLIQVSSRFNGKNAIWPTMTMRDQSDREEVQKQGFTQTSFIK